MSMERERDSRVRGGKAVEASPVPQGGAQELLLLKCRGLAGRAGPCSVMLIAGHLET